MHVAVNRSCFDQTCALPSIFVFSDSSGASFPESGFRYCKYVNLKLVFQVYFLLSTKASLFLQAFLIFALLSGYLGKSNRSGSSVRFNQIQCNFWLTHIICVITLAQLCYKKLLIRYRIAITLASRMNKVENFCFISWREL